MSTNLQIRPDRMTTPDFTAGSPLLRHCRRPFIILFLLFFIAPVTPAAIRTWDCGAGAPGNWSDRRNWQGDIAPASGDTLVFPPGAACLASHDDISLPVLSLDQILLTGNGHHMWGAWVDLSGGLTASASHATNTVALNWLRLSADQTFECTDSTSLLILPRITLETNHLTVNAVGDIVVREGFGQVGAFTKNGAGTLSWLGYASPSVAITSWVNAGTVVLSNANEVTSYAALVGVTVIGDGTGGALADVVQFAVPNQISGDVTIESSGYLNLNGHSGYCDALTLRGGSVAMGAGSLRLDSITSLASSRTATINGHISLTYPSLYDLDVAAGTANPDLLIIAAITNAGGLRKIGSGSLTLSGANTYQNTTRIEDGTVTLQHNSALGLTNGRTYVTNTAKLVVDRVDIGQEALYYYSTNPFTAYGPASWTGPVHFRPNATGWIDVPSGTFDLRGMLDCWIFRKEGAGTLRFSMNQAYAIGGSVTVNEGTLELDIAHEGILSPRFTVGDDVGGTEADVVRLLANNQIAADSHVTVNSSGLLDANGHIDSIGSLTLNGGRVATGVGTFWLQHDVTNNATTTARGIIRGQIGLTGTRTFNTVGHSWSPDLRIDASIAGASGLTKIGTGELSLNASNSYAGVTTVSEGTLEVDDSWALGDTSSGTVVSDAGHVTVRYDSQVDVEPLTLDSAGLLALKSALGSNSWAGPITLSSDARIDVDAAADYLNLRGVISGAGSLTKTGEGTLLFSGAANTYTGDTFVNEGVLELRKTGVNAIPNGLLTIGDGVGAARTDIVRLLSSSQIGAVPVRVNSSGLLDLNGFNDSFGELILDGGAARTGSGRLTLGGPVTALANATGNPSIAGELDLGIVGTRNIEVQATPEVPETLTISASVRGTPTLAKLGAGTLVLSGSNSYSGLTRIQEGVLAVGHPLALGSTNGLTVVSNGASLLLSSSSHITNEWLTLSGAGNALYPFALGSLAGTCSWSGPIALSTDSVLSTEPGDSTLALKGAISGSGGLTKIGLGTLQLSGATSNAYAGTTRVHGGVLELDKGVSDGAVAGPLVIGDDRGGTDADVVRIGAGALEQIGDRVPVTIAGSGLLDIRNGGERIGALSGSGHLYLEGAIFEVNYDNSSSVFSGVISGSGSPRKTGAGTLVLSGTNTHTGTTIVSNGRLQVDGSQPVSPLQVSAAGTLGGTGVVGRLTVSGGRVAPGASAGILTCSNVTFNTGSTFEVELNGTTAGTGYDQLNVRGSVNLSNTTLQVSIGGAPAEGDQFRILNNDGTDSIVGAFTGLTNGARFTVNGLPFQISYTGGTGNDVVLTVTNTALRLASAVAVQSGNGNGIIEPNECSTVGITLTNRAKDTVSGIAATLTTITPGVFVSQPFSTYPDLKGGDAGPNETPFQIATTPAFVCGATIELILTVTTSAHGTFSIPLVLPSGTAGSTVVFDSKTVTVIPDLDTIESVLNVSNLTTALIKVIVSCHITHPSDQDLDLTLVAPDGTEVVLSTDNGGTGDNYGSSCLSQNRTVFDDDSHLAITAGTAPFAGRFQPESPLAVLRGKSELEINGPWRLRITDDQAGNMGSLQCWSLSLTPAACAGGGGPCELCPNQTITGAIGESSLLQNGRLVRDGIASSCGTAKPCPGVSGTGTRSYDAYTFFNGGSSACITVALRAESDLFSAAYLGSHDPTALCTRYLADRGTGTQTEPVRDYSFDVPAGTTFVVVVNQVNLDDNGPYTLTVSGGDCQPVLHIRQDGARQVVLDWTTAAPAYQLEATDTLPPRTFQPVLPLPVVIGGKNTVTNEASSASRFFRLRKGEP